jgi:thioesterase domain-containing protein
MPDPRLLRRRLADVLAAGDVPHAVLRLPALPLDPNGKVDRAALPDPTTARPDLAVPFEAPADPLEVRIAGVWSEVLGVAPIGRHDPFFDLGGDSLDAARLALALDGVAAPGLLHDAVMTASTVAELAGQLGPAGSLARPVTWFGFHDAVGHPGFYAHLERAGRGAIRVQPVGPLDAGRPVRSIAAAATAAVEQICASGIEGPVHLIGYCYAAVVALEAAHGIERAGGDVASLVLLGIGPTEFPELVDRDALVADDRGRRLRHRLRAHLAEIRHRPPRAAAAYVAVRARRRLASARSTLRVRLARVGASGSTGHPTHPNTAAVAAHDSVPFDRPLTVVLGRSSAALYTRSPERAWSRLGPRVEVIVLPGHDHAMLGPAGAPGLVAALRDLGDPVP